MTPVLRVQNLFKHYPVRGASRSALHAADDVSFEIMPGETLALVGESGSGKSTVGKCILQLEDSTAGEITLDGVALTALASDELRKARRHIQIVFQDPSESLNPRMRVGDQVAEPLWLYGLLPRAQTAQRVRELFNLVGLLPDTAERYPHQLSGGQQQRVAIARALATDPKVVILDEPTSALDVSVQAQLILLLKELQQRLGMAYLFISHDLALVSTLAHRVAVMYLGQIVEVGDIATIFTAPRHPYTRALISATPTDDPLERKKRLVLLGEPPTPVDPAPACRLAGRCPFTRPECTLGEIPLQDIGDRHPVRCIRYIREHVNGVWSPTAEVEMLSAQATGAEGVR